MTDVRPCPECASGKHANCDGTAWDVDEDRLALCPCDDDAHARAAVARAEEKLRTDPATRRRFGLDPPRIWPSRPRRNR